MTDFHVLDDNPRYSVMVISMTIIEAFSYTSQNKNYLRLVNFILECGYKTSVIVMGVTTCKWTG